ncbi:MAG: hypothetical protein HC772_19730 [Leptolyngbyaceae cyanobacterium CRU_2_3]|nr:hypothetical protein [Leptolyngbyaceae cyanobacterium CRU_2_3]
MDAGLMDASLMNAGLMNAGLIGMNSRFFASLAGIENYGCLNLLLERLQNS